jgi:mRNA-degrading endonuclease RelE of RelBE toxin-antitoxin system
VKVRFKKAFLKDLEKLPANFRKTVENLVFEEIPKTQEFSDIKNTKKLKGDENFYRVRIGNSRIGFEYRDKEIVFYRVLHRKDIYRYFP